MRRSAPAQSLDQVIQAAVAGVVAHASVAIAKAIADIAAQELEKNLTLGAPVKPGRPARRTSRPRARVEVTRWVADRRARRVPNFVIDATGLKTKKAIVAKFGENAAFEKGKPLPKSVKAA